MSSINLAEIYLRAADAGEASIARKEEAARLERQDRLQAEQLANQREDRQSAQDERDKVVAAQYEAQNEQQYADQAQRGFSGPLDQTNPAAAQEIAQEQAAARAAADAPERAMRTEFVKRNLTAALARNPKLEPRLREHITGMVRAGQIDPFEIGAPPPPAARRASPGVPSGRTSNAPPPGRPLPATSAERLADTGTAISALQDLRNAYLEGVPNEGFFNQIAARLQSYIPNSSVSVYDKKAQLAAQKAGLILENGKLQASDFPRYLAMLTPRPGDSREAALAKIDNAVAMLTAADKASRQTFKESGYSVPGKAQAAPPHLADFTPEELAQLQQEAEAGDEGARALLGVQ